MLFSLQSVSFLINLFDNLENFSKIIVEIKADVQLDY